ncbi:hypothetical protein [Aeribacillus composti]|uniref:hypothetical protein n=1 Tax=Aeribacillus composti TaxID=1868734 RepID=UPI003D22848D
MNGLASEVKVVAGIENRYMTECRNGIYIACENLNFVWDPKEVQEFDRLWKELKKDGKTSFEIVQELAEHFERDPDEVAILAICRGRRGRI